MGSPLTVLLRGRKKKKKPFSGAAANSLLQVPQINSPCCTVAQSEATTLMSDQVRTTPTAIRSLMEPAPPPRPSSAHRVHGVTF